MCEGKGSELHTASQLSITIVMTAYNEEAVIAHTIDDCLTVIAQIPGNHEVLMVNDGSTDRTGEILNELSAKHPLLRVLVHPQNRGFVEAQRWLIREAKGDLIFHFAADGEWKACELHNLLARLREGYDIVVSVRRSKHYSPYRKIVSFLYNMLVLLLFRKNFHDIGSIRLVNARLWKQLPSVSSSAFFIAEKLLLAYRNGARVGFASVDHVWRVSGKSKFSNPLRALEAFWELFNFWLSPRSRQKINLSDAQASLQGILDGSK